ncbi:MAG: NUDIX domain-containing protein, partial [Actinocatenispora sp.]
GTDPYDLARSARLAEIGAELAGLTDRAGPGIDRVDRGPLGIRTPQVHADAAIFDDAGRLLLTRRADSGHWCMPGGAADVGESPSEAAVREAYEETGLRVRAEALIGVYDNRRLPGDGAVQGHGYHLNFACRVVGGALDVSHETTGFAWCTEPESAVRRLFRGHVLKVPAAYAWHRERAAPTFD